MEFRKVSVPLPEDPKTLVEGYEIPVAESVERWSDVKLEDGTVFRAKMNVLNVVRLIDRLDAQGNPVLLINASPVISLGQSSQATPKER